MAFNTSPPPPSTRLERNPTLLFSWWCTGFALAFILVRLAGRKIRNNQLFKEDHIMALSIIPLVARMALVHVVLIWGTNNVDVSGGLTSLQVEHRIVGSKLVLPARILYAAFIWTAKLTISEFLKRLTSTYWKRSYELTLKGIRAFLLLTFVGVVVATLAECQPFDHYWQVIPDPGPSCRTGYAQLLTMGIADMITDLLLVIFPVSLVALSPAFPIKRKLKLMTLFSLSAALIPVTAYRIKFVLDHNGKQQYRTVFASGEILGAAMVSNAIIIGSFLRDRGVKKQKYRYNSATDSMEHPSRRQTRSLVMNKSEDDLFRDMCYRSAHDPESPKTPRPPPRANPISPGTRRDSILKVPGSYFPDEKYDNASRHSQESDGKTAVEGPLPTPSIREIAPLSSPRRARNVSFCDVGGLLEDASSQSSTLAPSSPHTGTRDFALQNPPAPRRASEANLSSPPPVRRGSHALLQGIGGFLSPILQGQRRSSIEELRRTRSHEPSRGIDDIEMVTAAGGLSPIHEPDVMPSVSSPVEPVQLKKDGSSQSLQDVGGLLGETVPPLPPLPTQYVDSQSVHPLQSTLSDLQVPSSPNFSRPRLSQSTSPP